MKYYLVITLLFFISITCNAQQYVVCKVKGEVCQVVKSKKILLKKGMKLTPKDVINLADKSEIKLLNEQAREMITLKNQCAGSVSSLIASQKDSRKSVTVDYLAYIMNNLSRQGLENDILAGRTTSVFRDDSDSLFVKKDSVACDTTCSRNSSKDCRKDCHHTEGAK